MLASKLRENPSKYISFVALDDQCCFIGCMWAEKIPVDGKLGPPGLNRYLDERQDATDVREWIVKRGVTVFSESVVEECFISIRDGS